MVAVAEAGVESEAASFAPQIRTEVERRMQQAVCGGREEGIGEQQRSRQHLIARRIASSLPSALDSAAPSHCSCLLPPSAIALLVASFSFAHTHTPTHTPDTA